LTNEENANQEEEKRRLEEDIMIKEREERIQVRK